MFELPVKFPSERERLLRMIEAGRHRTMLERIQAVEALLATIRELRKDDQATSRDALRDMREAEGRRCFRELIRRHTERADSPDTASDGGSLPTG
jgi:hypothetical protein